jgi:hypothetical protein
MSIHYRYVIHVPLPTGQALDFQKSLQSDVLLTPAQLEAAAKADLKLLIDSGTLQSFSVSNLPEGSTVSVLGTIPISPHQPQEDAK